MEEIVNDHQTATKQLASLVITNCIAPVTQSLASVSHQMKVLRTNKTFTYIESCKSTHSLEGNLDARNAEPKLYLEMENDRLLWVFVLAFVYWMAYAASNVTDCRSSLVRCVIVFLARIF